MDGVNKVTLIGNVGKEVELNVINNEKKVAKIVLATNKTVKDQNGNSESRTEWHNVDVWDKTAQFCADYVKKGTLLYVEGELRTDSYEDKDGIKRYRTKIVAKDVKILSNPSSTGSPSSKESTPAEQAQNQSKEYVESSKSTVSSSNFVSGADDDLPF